MPDPNSRLDGNSGIYQGPVPGKVVDRKDPEKTNKIKIRVKSVYGEINKDSLPWAPPISGGSVPLGGPPAGDPPKEFGQCHVPYKGSWVATYFLDGDHMDPVYGGAMPPEKSTPKRFKGKEDEVFKTIKDNLVSGDISELESKLPQYPDVHGTLYSSGVLFEVDEGDGAERLLWFHPSGWRNEVLPSGDHVIHVEGKQQVIVMSDREIHVAGNLKEVIKGNAETIVEGDQTQEIQGNSEQTVQGNMTMTIQGNDEKTVQGSAKQTYEGGLKQSVTGSSSEEVSGSKTIKSSGTITLQASGVANIQGSLVRLSAPTIIG